MKRSSLQEIAQALKERDNFIICGHVNPDGDCISSQVALALTLQSLGKNVINLLADCTEVDISLKFLPGVDNFVSSEYFVSGEEWEAMKLDGATFVSVDVPLMRRIGRYAPAVKNESDFTITIDHHEPEDIDSNLLFSDPSAASCSLLIWELLPHLDVTPTADIANACICGVISDTGSYRYQNADTRCFKASAQMVDAGAQPAEVSLNLFQRRSINSLQLQSRSIEHMFVNTDKRFALSYLGVEDFEEYSATKDDADFMIDMLRSLDAVDVVCMLRQQKQGADIHGSLRSKTDVDVSKLARCYVGGGHKAAAGFTMKGCNDMNAAFEEIKAKLSDIVA